MIVLTNIKCPASRYSCSHFSILGYHFGTGCFPFPVPFDQMVYIIFLVFPFFRFPFVFQWLSGYLTPAFSWCGQKMLIIVLTTFLLEILEALFHRHKKKENYWSFGQRYVIITTLFLLTTRSGEETKSLRVVYSLHTRKCLRESELPAGYSCCL